MIQILAGEKGQGKTKRLIAMANEASKTIDGNVVFIDDDNRHMYDLHYNIRFVKTNFVMNDQKIFFGFTVNQSKSGPFMERETALPLNTSRQYSIRSRASVQRSSSFVISGDASLCT